ncbi:MAG: 2-C-methyl-D-erythritol 2,4-cyclodiphosphate synthase [Chlamydiota bacterium]|nr:2-C-methyl-D-erythritol 2,4-cyclodiphosphate synthase [Chlamydiota bacterium]
MMRIGCGLDVHPLMVGKVLILGGVNIASDKGAVGHSDADCLTHAIMDALLGAAGLGDIGKYFPPSDPQYRGISSLLLLEQVRALLDDHQYKIGNIDASIALESPRIATFAPAMCQNIARCLGVQPRQINVKATTYEGLGVVGRSEAIVVYAVALLEEIQS